MHGNSWSAMLLYIDPRLTIIWLGCGVFSLVHVYEHHDSLPGYGVDSYPGQHFVMVQFRFTLRVELCPEAWLASSTPMMATVSPWSGTADRHLGHAEHNA